MSLSYVEFWVIEIIKYLLLQFRIKNLLTRTLIIAALEPWNLRRKKNWSNYCLSYLWSGLDDVEYWRDESEVLVSKIFLQTHTHKIQFKDCAKQLALELKYSQKETLAVIRLLLQDELNKVQIKNCTVKGLILNFGY